MKHRLDIDKIAKGVGGERRGAVSAKGGYFGAMQLLGEVEKRFRVPPSGGRQTDPGWTERRLLPLSAETLRRLEELAAEIQEQRGIVIAPMQLAALLLEKTAQGAGADRIEELLGKAMERGRRKRRAG